MGCATKCKQAPIAQKQQWHERANQLLVYNLFIPDLFVNDTSIQHLCAQ